MIHNNRCNKKVTEKKLNRWFNLVFLSKNNKPCNNKKDNLFEIKCEACKTIFINVLNRM